jgi:hypothetical protein
MTSVNASQSDSIAAVAFKFSRRACMVLAAIE